WQRSIRFCILAILFNPDLYAGQGNQLSSQTSVKLRPLTPIIGKFPGKNFFAATRFFRFSSLQPLCIGD
ncbi:MAG: hypothetical protein R6W89_07890, partial [Candidatus Hydrogenedentota bacterium]